MDERGRQTEMPRMALPRDHRRAESVIWGLAIGLAVLFALGQVFTILAAAPAVIAFHQQGGTMPPLVAWASALGPLGIGALLGVMDVMLLGLFLWMGRRYWVGLAFVPPVLFLGIGSVILWLLVSQALTSAALR